MDLTPKEENLILNSKYMKSAINIGNYYLEHAKVAFQMMGVDEVTNHCKYIRKMDDRADKYQKQRLLKNILK
jgi:hypothetical protein